VRAQRGGLSPGEFATAGGSRPKTLQWWASELLRRAKAEPERRRVRFRKPRSTPKVAIARVVRREATADETLVVRVADAVIAVCRGFDAQLLHDVVAALGGRRR
jgi:hypothetical protein